MLVHILPTHCLPTFCLCRSFLVVTVLQVTISSASTPHHTLFHPVMLPDVVLSTSYMQLLSILNSCCRSRLLNGTKASSQIGSWSVSRFCHNLPPLFFIVCVLPSNALLLSFVFQRVQRGSMVQYSVDCPQQFPSMPMAAAYPTVLLSLPGAVP